MGGDKVGDFRFCQGSNQRGPSPRVLTEAEGSDGAMVWIFLLILGPRRCELATAHLLHVVTCPPTPTLTASFMLRQSSLGPPDTRFPPT